jgi:hypothetical protein
MSPKTCNPKNSKKKGNTFEGAIAKLIKEYFIPETVPPKVSFNLIHRTGLSGGRTERSDLVVQPPLLNYFKWFTEVKNRESWDWAQIFKNPFDNLVFSWYQEAVDKCHKYEGTEERFPLLVFTKNFQPNYVLFNNIHVWYSVSSNLALIDTYTDTWRIELLRTSSSEGIREGYNIVLFSTFLAWHTKPDLNIFKELDF